MGNILRIMLVILGLQLFLSSSVQALAVGDITVHSRQGEPFAAEIRLHLEPRERESGVEVALGNQDAYRAEGLKRPALIDVLTVLVTEAHDTIRISSQAAIQETSIPLLLSIRVRQVTIIKHYRVTLPASTPAMVQALPSLPTIAQVTRAARPPKAAAKVARRTQTQAGRYGPIERGDTLYNVARSLALPSDKVWQAVVVLWRTNKNQFAAGNLHGLNVGTYLDIPPDLAESVATLRLAEVQEIVAGQWEEWQALQRLGTGKQRIMAAAARDPEAAIAAYGKRAPSDKQDMTPPPIEKSSDKPTSQAVVLPVGKPGNMVSMTELQNVLQGLEERLMRRLTPTSSQEFKAVAPPATAFVSASELQASIQNLEDRLTQRMQQMLLHTQTPEPMLVGQRASQHVLQLTQTPPALEASQSTAMTFVPYLLVLTNILLLVLVGALLWLWLRRRDRVARMQRV